MEGGKDEEVYRGRRVGAPTPPSAYLLILEGGKGKHTDSEWLRMWFIPNILNQESKI